MEIDDYELPSELLQDVINRTIKLDNLCSFVVRSFFKIEIEPLKEKFG